MSRDAIVCSWSGGKDSCLALWRAVQAGSRLCALTTMFTEDGQRSRSHGLSREVLAAQAEALGVPLLSRSATWDDYEQAFVDLLRDARRLGATAVVFGDIDIPRHRQWEENVCWQAGLAARLPLWQTDRLTLLDEFWDAGFECRLVAIRDGLVDRKYLGRVLDRALAVELSSMGIDACGENGEFHTLVTAGPLFRQPLRFALGEQVLKSGCWFQDVSSRSGTAENCLTIRPAPTRARDPQCQSRRPSADRG
jgi:diphthine-ammonia ligase